MKPFVQLKLSERDELLVELVHFLASAHAFKDKHGNVFYDLGLSLQETKVFLGTKIRDKNDKTPLRLLKEGGRGYLNELITEINTKLGL